MKSRTKKSKTKLKFRAEKNDYTSLIFRPKHLTQDRITIGIPMTGLLRSEWVLARYSQVIPCNWGNQEFFHWMNNCSPIGFAVAEARNVITEAFIKSGNDWLLFIDHDVILPPNAFIKINEYMNHGRYPVVCGLYFAKCHPPEPLIYRGRNNSHYRDFKIGDKVWVDGIPMGCTLIHRSLMKLMWDDAEEYIAGGNLKVRKVFDTPAGVYHDPQSGGSRTYSGTEDLAWCNRVIAGDFLKKAGWPKIAKQKYPFLCDTSLFCRHITFDGQTYPLPDSWGMSKEDKETALLNKTQLMKRKTTRQEKVKVAA